jgi:DNA polymerase-3 subunit chi
MLAGLDAALWTKEAASFLPHGLAGTPHDPDQPILLSDRLLAPAPNGARLLMLVGQPLPPEAEAFDRIFLLFEDGTDAHARARADWRAAANRATLERSYWQQTESGGWARKGGT